MKMVKWKMLGLTGHLAPTLGLKLLILEMEKYKNGEFRKTQKGVKYGQINLDLLIGHRFKKKLYIFN